MAGTQQYTNLAMLAVLLTIPITTSANKDVMYKPLNHPKRQEPEHDPKPHVDEMPAWSTSSSPDGLKLDLQHGRFSFLHGTKVQQPSPTPDAANESENDPILASAPTQTELLEASAPTETLPYEHDVPDCTHLVSGSGSWELPSFHPWHVSATSLTWGFMAATVVVCAAAHFVQRMRRQRRRTLARHGSLPFTEKGVLAVEPE